MGYNRVFIFVLSIIFLLSSMSAPARADCVDPAAPEGMQIYNSTYKTMQFCDGTTWWSMKGGGAGGSVAFDECQEGEGAVYSVANNRFECPYDHAPDTFTFTDQTGVEPSTQVQSDIIQISNVDDDTDVSVSGDGSPEYRICADGICAGAPAYTSAAGTIDDGEYFQLRLTSSADFETALAATITVGDASDQWQVTTRPDCYIVNESHDCADCSAAGGVLVDSGGGAGEKMCKFSEALCPSGWTQFQNWGTFGAQTSGLTIVEWWSGSAAPGIYNGQQHICNDALGHYGDQCTCSGCNGTYCCSTPEVAWANQPSRPTCPAQAYCSGPGWTNGTYQAQYTEIGCY